MNNYAVPKYTGLEAGAGVDLGRFVLLLQVGQFGLHLLNAGNASPADPDLDLQGGQQADQKQSHNALAHGGSPDCGVQRRL